MVLAAGLGRRLGGDPKALYSLDGRTLIERCADRLLDAGFDEMTVVTGHGADLLEDAWRGCEHRLGARFMANARYAELNNFFTVQRACEEFRGESLLVLNSDIVFTRETLRGMVEGPASPRLAVEPGATDEEALKVRVEGTRAVELGKHLPSAAALGEFIGISQLTPAAAGAYVAAAEAALAAGEHDLYYEDVYSRIAAEVEFTVVRVERGAWAEIDEPRDVPAAERVVRTGSGPAARRASPACARERPATRG